METHKTFTDQMHRKVSVSFPPQRIISVVPSQTELLHYLGLDDRVVGITKFCVHPKEWFRNKKRIGGTKALNIEAISALNPDLIIGNKEENVKAQINQLATQYPVWMSDIKTLDDALDMILSIGDLTNTSEKATQLVTTIQANFEQLAIAIKNKTKPKVAYFIWREPYMIAANDTFIHEMLTKAGFENVLAHKSRYPQIDFTSEMSQLQPDAILLSSEPYPFKEVHYKEFQNVYPNAVIKLVDGELFSWYGSRLLYASIYFQQLNDALR